jgi:diguanylate cyclase
VALPWASLLSHGARLDTYRLGICGEPIRVQLTCGVVLGLLSVLAWYRERFTAERGERLSLEGLAYTDPTTGLPNRRALYPRTVPPDCTPGPKTCWLLRVRARPAA